MLTTKRQKTAIGLVLPLVRRFAPIGSRTNTSGRKARKKAWLLQTNSWHSLHSTRGLVSKDLNRQACRPIKEDALRLDNASRLKLQAQSNTIAPVAQTYAKYRAVPQPETEEQFSKYRLRGMHSQISPSSITGRRHWDRQGLAFWKMLT